MATRMQQRRGTASQWTSSNEGAGPILNAGEIGWESDTNKFKIGDGVSYWSALTYFVDATDVIASSLGAYLQDSDVGAISGVAGLDASKNLVVPGTSIHIEGATDNTNETTLTVVDPTADRTITFPDATGTVAILDATQTLTNKSISLGSNTVTSTLAQLNTAVSDADVASLAGTETLTNKTLTSPVISSITNTGTLTLPTTTGTVALTSDITTAINNLVDGAPAALDTLNELAAAINDDASYAGTITSALGLKAPLASPTFTGTVTLADGAVLGTPLSGTLTNATGLPVSTGISGLGTGVATFLATPSSANFASMISDEIGTGNVLLSDLATNSQSASYTLVLTDKAKIVEMGVGSANTLTVPINSSVAFPVGTQINIVQTGSGQTTVGGAGVTINTATTLKLRAQWSAATLIKRAENTWVLVGDLATS